MDADTMPTLANVKTWLARAAGWGAHTANFGIFSSASRQQNTVTAIICDSRGVLQAKSLRRHKRRRLHHTVFQTLSALSVFQGQRWSPSKSHKRLQTSAALLDSEVTLSFHQLSALVNNPTFLFEFQLSYFRSDQILPDVWTKRWAGGHQLHLQKSLATKHDYHRFPNANIVLFNVSCRHSWGTQGGLVHRHFTKPRQISCLFSPPCCLGNIILLGRQRVRMHSWDGNPLVKLHNWKCKHIQEQDVTKALRNMNKALGHVCGKLLSCYFNCLREAMEARLQTQPMQTNSIINCAIYKYLVKAVLQNKPLPGGFP